MLSAATTTYALQALIDHDGPNGQGHAFPSGHSTLAFAGAAFVQRRYGWRPALPAWLAAGFVGYSRIQFDNHDFTEVATGAGISIAWTWFFTTPWQEQVAVVPLMLPRGGGLLLTGSW